MLPPKSERGETQTGEERARTLVATWMRDHLRQFDFADSNIFVTSTFFQNRYAIRIIATQQGAPSTVEMTFDIKQNDVIGDVVRAPYIATVDMGPTDGDE